MSPPLFASAEHSEALLSLKMIEVIQFVKSLNWIKDSKQDGHKEVLAAKSGQFVVEQRVGGGSTG
mgnify:FL=1